jgi:hypothetical protein
VVKSNEEALAECVARDQTNRNRVLAGNSFQPLVLNSLDRWETIDVADHGQADLRRKIDQAMGEANRAIAEAKITDKAAANRLLVMIKAVIEVMANQKQKPGEIHVTTDMAPNAHGVPERRFYVRGSADRGQTVYLTSLDQDARIKEAGRCSNGICLVESAEGQ